MTRDPFKNRARFQS